MFQHKEIEQYLHSEFEPLVGEITVRRLFTGFGVFKDDLMFVLYQARQIYLRAEGDLVKALQERGAARFRDITPNMSPSLALYHYYQLPMNIVNDKALFKTLAKISVSQVKENKLKAELAKKNRIKELVNFTIKHERLLAKVGIYTVEEFHKVGAFEAFLRLKKQGIQATPMLFITFYAALRNINVNLLNENTKRRCLEKLNEYFWDNGFRRFNIERYLRK